MTRRGMVILAVMIAIVIAALIAMSALSAASSGAVYARASDRSSQLRAMAQSGVSAAAAELASQRDQLLQGAGPKLTTEWELFKDSDIHATIRLLPVDAPGPNPAGAEVEQVARPLAMSLDVNIAEESMLGAIVGPEDAARIVQQRARRFWTDRAECISFLRQGQSAASASVESAFAPASALPEAPLPSDAQGDARLNLSASNFDPQVCRADPKGAGDWVPAVNIAAGLDDAAGTRLDDLLGPELSSKVRAAIKAKPPTNREQLLAALNGGAISANDWSRVLEVVRFDENPFVIGRVDLNRASAATLAAIPGFTPESAEAAVRTRDRLDVNRRSQLAWPVLEQVLTPEAFARASDWLTIRSMVWEVRVEASIERAETKAVLARAAWVVTIDVADPRPRIVSIRDLGLEESMQWALTQIPPPEPADLALEEPTPNNPRMDSPPEIMDDGQSGVGLAIQEEPAPQPLVPLEPIAPASPKDNRLGRWTTGSPR